jgi:hypothetical protein
MGERYSWIDERITVTCCPLASQSGRTQSIPYILSSWVDFICSPLRKQARQGMPDGRSQYRLCNPHPVGRSRCRRQALAVPAHTLSKHKTTEESERTRGLTRRKFPSTQNWFPFAFCSKVPAPVTRFDILPSGFVNCWRPGLALMFCVECVPPRQEGRRASLEVE